MLAAGREIQRDGHRYPAEAIGTFALAFGLVIAFWSVRRFPAREVVPYVLAQCAGATTAAFVLRWISAGRRSRRDATGIVVKPPFALGATVFAGALVAGPLTCGSFNPARSFGPALAGGGWAAHWLYWVAPVAGMVVAMHLHERLQPASAPSVPKELALGVEGPIELPGPVVRHRTVSEVRSTQRAYLVPSKLFVRRRGGRGWFLVSV